MIALNVSRNSTHAARSPKKLRNRHLWKTIIESVVCKGMREYLLWDGRYMFKFGGVEDTVQIIELVGEEGIIKTYSDGCPNSLFEVRKERERESLWKILHSPN